MFIPYTKAQRINESWCMFVAWRDGRTADAEHRRQQQRHIYVVYVPPHAPCPWFGMSAMFRAMAAEVRWVLISTLIFLGCLGPKFVSQALDTCFLDAFFARYLSGTMSWGLKPCFSAYESRRMTSFFIPYLSVRIRNFGAAKYPYVFLKLGGLAVNFTPEGYFGV